MAAGRGRRKPNSTTPASPGKTVEGNKAATRTSPRRSNDSQTGAQSETTTVPSASSTKESMTTTPPGHNQQTEDEPNESMTASSPSHNQQTQDVGNNDSALSASEAAPSDVSAANSPENIDKSGEGTVHDVSTTGRKAQKQIKITLGLWGI